MKAIVLILSVLGAALGAAVFGIVHDQLTYSISPEYYTKFKFHQFGLADYAGVETTPRLYVAFVGVFATWWVGAALGVLLGLLALIQKNARQMAKVMATSVAIVIGVTALTALGAGLSFPYVADSAVPLTGRDGIEDRFAFTQVGYIHTLSYLGGAVGGLMAALYGVYVRFIAP